MSITNKQMRLIDNYAGKPICYILSLYALSKKILFREKQAQIKKILFTKFLGMGSIVHATPLIRSIKQRYPEAKICFLTFAENKDFVNCLGLAHEVLSIRTKNIIVFISDVLGTLYQLNKEKLDIAFNLEFFSKFGAILNFLSRAQITAGYYLNEPWRTHLISHKIYYNHYKHISEIFMALGNALGANSKNLSLEKPIIRSGDKKHIDRLFKEHSIRNDDWKVLINVNTSGLFLNRSWPTSYFSVLIDKIINQYGAYIILIGGKEDIDRVGKVMALLENKEKVMNLAGKTNIPQLLALIEQVDMVISNDSGPLHFAVMMGTPSISFFGPESPVQYGPKGSIHTVIYKGYYCSPCLHVYNEKNSKCKNNFCLKDISVNEVFEVVEHNLKKGKCPSHGKIQL